MNALLAWYFVAVWGSGYVFTKLGLQYAPLLAMFGLLPGPLALAGMAIACTGVAMTVWTPRWRSSTSSR